MDDFEVWGEREQVIHLAATEINEHGELCVDTHMRVMAHGITVIEVAHALQAIIDSEEESE